jgi:outer membrane immunogenic protein
MRRVMCALLALVFAPSAFADEWLPGPPTNVPVVNGWAGFYLGGQLSYSSGDANFTTTTQAPIAYALRETTLEADAAPSMWPVLGTGHHSAAGFGGFVGYNMQYEKLVLGIEANYDQANLSFTAPNTPISRITSAGSSSYLVDIIGSGTASNLDFGTLRARAGWAMGNFLPYVFGGLAVGKSNVAISATVSGEQNPPSSGPCSSGSSPPCTPFSFTGTAGRGADWMYGFTVGTGLDVALTRNVFLRAEYEYVQFAPVQGLIVDINTVRAGAAFKF